jgi:hypothetical protein
MGQKRTLAAGAAVAALTAGLAGHAAPASAGPIIPLVVTTTNDEVNGATNGVSLREAMSTASSDGLPSVIVLATGATYSLTSCGATNPTGDLDHGGADSLVINGNGSTIDQTCASERVLESGTPLTVDSITLTGGDTTSNGGGIFSLEDVTIQSSTVRGNRGDIGGGVFVGGALVLQDSTVAGNEALTDVGGVLGNGGATVVSSQILDNGAPAGGTGGIGASDGLVMSRSTVAGNEAGNGDGGGIRADGSTITITESTISGNSSTDDGGGVYLDDTGTFVRSTVAGNSAVDVGANVASPVAGIDATGTVFADALGPATSCFLANATGGSGDNYEEATDTCDLAVADANRPDPQLRPVFNNGGTTRTRFPRENSPLLEAMAGGDIDCTGSDQRLVNRPQGDDCDEGSVEVALCSDIFDDVAGDNAFCWEIGWMSAAGVTTGFPGNLYKPNSSVTRQAMSAFMYRLAGSPPFTDPVTATFSDVGTGSTFFTEIEWMNDEGITTGFPGGIFKPAEAVTRQAMSAFMYRLAGEPVFVDPVTPTFPDVGTGTTFFTEIEWMNDEGITTGFNDGTFRPSGLVTRASMSAFMYRLAELPILPEA